MRILTHIYKSNLRSLVNYQTLLKNRNFQVFTSVQNKHSNLNRQVKALGKLLGNKQSGSKRKWYVETTHPTLPTATSLSKTDKQGRSSNRRVNILNKLFMKNITDLLASGDISEKIIGKSLEISRVKVSNDFHFINVFWIAKGNANDDYLEEILQRYSGLLRHELSQLRLMGEVPRIHFIKDKLYSNIAEVEVLLKQCDFGDEYESTVDKANEVKCELNLENTYNLIPKEHDAIPIMRHDVMGLNHKEILGKILTKMKKAKDAWDQHLSASDPKDKIDSGDHTTSNVLRLIQENQAAKEEEFKILLQKRKKNRPDRKIHLDYKTYELSDQYEDDPYLKEKNDDGDFIEEDQIK